MIIKDMFDPDIIDKYDLDSYVFNRRVVVKYVHKVSFLTKICSDFV